MDQLQNVVLDGFIPPDATSYFVIMSEVVDFNGRG
jgi:hypothetical protein